MELLTVLETAARLRCGKSHVYELISRGELEATDISLGRGRAKTRVTTDAVDDFIRARTTTAPDRPARAS